MVKNLQSRSYRQLSVEAWPKIGLSPVNKLVVVGIVASLVLLALETEKSLSEQFQDYFDIATYFFAGFFLIEYIARIWSAGADDRYRGFRGRIRFAASLPLVVDFIALLPFFAGAVFDDLFLLRLFRLARIFGLARFGQYSIALRLLVSAVVKRHRELLLTVALAIGILFVSGTAMFLIEGPAQPEAFGSIPRALWWSVATLTTVGYGDVYPVTAAGKFFAALMAVASIGMVAMPAGILAAACSDAFQRNAADDPDGFEKIDGNAESLQTRLDAIRAEMRDIKNLLGDRSSS